jgi:hypothetical protein
MPRIPTCISPSTLELRWFLAVRKETFQNKSFYACLVAITLCTALLPLFVTGAASFGAAREECYAKTLVRNKLFYPDWTAEDNFDDWAANRLLPRHSFTSISTVMSLFGFGVWLFFSPHNSDAAQDLDRTLGSYFALQWLANLLVLASSLATNCNAASTSVLTGTVGTLVDFLATFGLSCIGTNLLCHRYLCEKARIMIKLYVERAFTFQ